MKRCRCLSLSFMYSCLKRRSAFLRRPPHNRQDAQVVPPVAPPPPSAPISGPSLLFSKCLLSALEHPHNRSHSGGHHHEGKRSRKSGRGGWPIESGWNSPKRLPTVHH